MFCVALEQDIRFLGILIDFSLTAKAATLIFISWRGSSISSAKVGEIRLYL